MKKIIRLLFLTSFITLLFNACDHPESPVEYKLVREYTRDIPVSWNSLFLQIERYANFYRPCPVTRTWAYIQYAAYEVCVPGMPTYNTLQAELSAQSFIPELQSREGIDYPTALNSCYAYLFRKFFENAVFVTGLTKERAFEMISQLENDNLTSREQEVNNSRFIINSKVWGEEVGHGVWNWAETDRVAAESYFSEANARPHDQGELGDGKWQSANPGVKGMFPYWGDVRRFGLAFNDLIIPPPLNTADTSKRSIIYAQALDVFTRTKTIENNPNNEDSWIAQFWSDDRVGLTFSPPSRFFAIVDQLYDIDNSSLEKVVYTDAMLGLALNDAAVACWKNKYYYNVERPISYIHKAIDPSWNLPWLPSTPAFPAYPSGHSTFGYAAATIFEEVFRTFPSFQDSCHAGRLEFLSSPRKFETFEQMAYENAISRIPLGVHFLMDAEGGKILGKRAGNAIVDLRWKK